MYHQSASCTLVLREVVVLTAVGAVLQVEVLLGAEQAAALKKLVREELVLTEMVKKELIGSLGPCCMLL